MDIVALVEQGASNPVVLMIFAMLLGGLHGLEPGHSKTMMAAFVIAVRGTVGQAVLLGLSAAVSHSIIVWVLAILAITYGNELIAEDFEPWLLVLSGVIILIMAAWIFRDTLRARRNKEMRGGLSQAVAAHAHGSNAHGSHGHGHEHHSHGGEAHSHGHDDLSEDAHARAHARQIEEKFSSGRATNLQVLTFGLTGGLLPCPAAITVLLLCLQLQKLTLGITLVSGFSIGLALTLVAVGVVAAWGLAQASKRTSRIDWLFNRAPYISVALITVLGVVTLWSGLAHLPH